MSSVENAIPRFPLFYRDPQLLSSELHAGWSLRDGDASFAGEAAFVPIVVGEFNEVTCSFPIVFAAGEGAPLAVLGLEHANLFVADGVWYASNYVPAYVRRYPFGFIATTQPAAFALSIDAGSDRIDRSGTDGTPLFEDGKPSELTRQALAFCDAFRAEAAATEEFAKALRAKGLLIDRHADATLPDGSKLGVTGFQIVDQEKFTRLDAGTIVEWHTKGWLALVTHHLASLARFNDLLALQSARRISPLAEPIPPASKAKKLAKADADTAKH